MIIPAVRRSTASWICRYWTAFARSSRSMSDGRLNRLISLERVDLHKLFSSRIELDFKSLGNSRPLFGDDGEAGSIPDGVVGG